MVGIGGIGMSAIARWFIANDKQVAGYDKTETALTKSLASEGIAIHFEDSVEQVPTKFLENKEDTLVIYTPAIPQDHKELNWLKAEGFTVLKRSQALGLITEKNFTIAVAGTHGKTTTSSMIAHILKSANQNFVAFLGGVTTNYGTNLLTNQNPDEDLVVVVEADEFDRSFLTLNPDIAIVTSVEADHLDIYGSAEAIEKSFADFIGKLKDEGVLFIQKKVTSDVFSKLQKGVEVRTYGVEEGDFKAANLKIVEGVSHFDIVVDDDANEMANMALKVPGRHNAENATAAIAVCLSLGLEPEQIQQGIASFEGVKRRFEYVVKSEKTIYIDDYAHHPTEVEAFLSSVKQLYPNKKLTAIFQPHLFTRTRDFADGFAKSLSIADQVLLMEIYPAREQPIEGVNSQMLLDKIEAKQAAIIKDEKLIETINQLQPELLVTVGAGNIDRFIEEIKDVLMR
ncbi:MAG: UDP-N-acetylmuramate--alanine ligase [Bacteroidia bacterium]|jgi:UDP-N-acetylmuramate--alanine ligase